MAKILIVDDSLFTRRSLKEILTYGGHEIVAEASNGIKAFTEYSLHKPDIVTMDITMPLLNGLDAIKNILDSFKDAKIIVISAIAQKSMVFDALQLGAKHYIIKPFAKEKVLETVNAVLMESDSEEGPVLQPASQKNSPRKASYKPLQYSFENMNGKLIVNVFKTIDLDGFETLKSEIPELSKVKPFKIILNFGDMSTITMEISKKINDIVTRVRYFSGSIVIVSKKSEFIKSIVDFNINTLTSIYSNEVELYNLQL